MGERSRPGFVDSINPMPLLETKLFFWFIYITQFRDYPSVHLNPLETWEHI